MSDKTLEDLFTNALLKESAGKLQEIVKDRINGIQEDLLDRVSKLSDKLSDRIESLENKFSNVPLTVNIGTLEKPKNIITHKCFDKIIKILKSAKRINKNIMLVGPAGSGKSSLVSQVADVLKLQFYPMSVGLQTTKSDLLGFINAKGDYITSPVREAYEKGGVLLLDEFDTTHAGVITILNSMLANDFCSFPDKIITKHKDFICFVACNTYGKGGSIDYVGRNRLDGATLDRFICVDVDYDETLEKQLAQNNEWLKIINKMRKNIEQFGLKVIISPRASMQGADLLEAGFSVEEVLEMCIYKGLNSDTKNKLSKDVDFKGLGNKIKTNKNTNKLNKKPAHKIQVSINFDTGMYTTDGLFDNIEIIGNTDWNSRYSIFISAGSTWATGLTNSDLFLNSGKNMSFSYNTIKKECINSFLRDLNLYYKDVVLEDGQTIKLDIVHEGDMYIYDIG